MAGTTPTPTTTEAERSFFAPPPPPAVTSTTPAVTIQATTRSKRWMVLALVFCPCHLPLLAALAAAIGFGSAGAFMTDNRSLLTLALLPMMGLCALMAFRASKRRGECGEACDPGSR